MFRRGSSRGEAGVGVAQVIASFHRDGMKLDEIVNLGAASRGGGCHHDHDEEQRQAYNLYNSSIEVWFS